MAKRSVSDSFWGDPFVQDIKKDAKLLFLYLWTNRHCNSAGIYEITTKTISFETDIPIDEIPGILELLAPKVSWFAEFNLVWVKNFLKHQPKSPLFLKNVAGCLYFLNNTEIETQFREYYRSLGVSIPYLYPMGSGGIPSSKDIDTNIYLHLDNNLDNIDKEPTMQEKGSIATTSENGKLNPFQLFEESYQKLTATNSDVLKDFIETYGQQEVSRALKEGIKYNKRSLAYVEAVLKGDGNGNRVNKKRPCARPVTPEEARASWGK